MPLLSIYIKLVYLILIIDNIYIPAILKYVVFELYELFGLSHAGSFGHPLDLLGVGVDDKALRGEVGVQEAPENHDLVLVYRETAQLRPLGVTAGARQVNVLPVRRPVEIV